MRSLHINRIRLQPEQFPVDDMYPFDLAVFRKTKEIALRQPVTFFIGENGSGKSTLLRAIARRCRIHIWKGIPKTRAVHSPYEERLHEYLSVNWTEEIVPGSFFSVENYRNYAKTVDSWAAASPGILEEYGGRSLVTQSHGQSLMSYFRNRYNRKGLYLMDEPETALSPRHQIELLNLLYRLAQKKETQFIIATHSPILLACPDADIISFDRVPAGPIAYQDTEYYRVYRDFLADPNEYIDND